jgi:hypothetical protein
MTESDLIDPTDVPHLLDAVLEEADVYLSEAMQALTFPEAYGLQQDMAVRKIKRQIETVREHMDRARELSSDLCFSFDMGLAQMVVEGDEGSRPDASGSA